ncbi:hypothetical protein CC78DRAFT_536066 [Lojkania enalia]|uniref:PHD-type domain-containing protein n=1 Tax=Lojkania enalia TaxID=147567 RepID=A0A9P4K6A1_9PLEO|nr:hypothetical protein CC78DRAFT_536066 [Didymosphaeria enalia]
MSSISSLLNHEPASEQPQSRPADQPEQRYYQRTTTTLDEAADALATLATLGPGQQYVTSRDLPSPTAFAHPPRRTSSFGSQHIAPVEPSPPIEQPQAHSPTLDQYHHGSKSPEEQRRQSLLIRSSPAPVLAPIQSLTSALHDRIHDELQPMSTSYGKDVSQMVPPPSRSSDDSESIRDSTQNREPAFVRDEPTTLQIREPEPTSDSNTPHSISTNVPLSHSNGSQLPSPQPIIKNEPTGTPREATPTTNVTQSSERQPSISGDSMDVETLKAIEAVKQSELGLRAKKAPSTSESIASPTDTKPVPAPSKKRPAPATSAVKKKGTAAPKKPASKRRKLDTDPSAESHARSVTPTSRTSKTPTVKAVKKGSQRGTPVAESSPAPDNSSQAHPSDDEGESSDDNQVYCICRKPDNHKWMIGCDGGCDDWFHGSCVNMQQADEDLVDRFICPNCEAAGRGVTTWKPMCRRDGCRKPARLEKGRMSKYCSDECGVLFFQDQLQRTAGSKKALAGTKKSKKKGSKDDEAPDQASDDDDEPTPLGGVLRAKDVKALALASKDIDAFKRLGSGVLSPPQTASPTKVTFDNLSNGTSNPVNDPSLTPAESARLNALYIEKTDLKNRLEVLKDREKFVSLVREQAPLLAEREKIKPKEFCGYDSRLSWSETEFLGWRKSVRGEATFRFNTLSVSKEQIVQVEKERERDGRGANGVAEPPSEMVCLKKRCAKHPQWQKLNLQDARFEEVEVMEAIRECEKEERSVRERARRRRAKDCMAKELVGEKGEGKSREGWVEVVEV